MDNKTKGSNSSILVSRLTAVATPDRNEQLKIYRMNGVAFKTNDLAHMLRSLNDKTGKNEK